MHHSFRRALLASVLGLGVLAGLVRADGHHQPPYYRYAQSYYTQDLLTTPQQPAKQHPLLDRLHAHRWFDRSRTHPWSCWAHHNDPTCGSLKADCAFIFGSCRTFFGESCRQGPAPLPLPYGSNGYGRCP